MKPSAKNHKDYLRSCILDTFFIFPTTAQEIEDIINNLDPSKSSGIYHFPIDLIKLIAKQIAVPLETIANDSFKTGCFPDKLKIQMIIPLHKNGSKLNVSNFRPISLLPVFSKIIEKLMLSRLKSYLDKHKIIYEHQYGFQKGKSTTLALLSLLFKIIESFENKMYTSVVFLDFAKAFDTVNLNILLEKLSHYGFRGTSLKWFMSYLIGRHQLVSINGTQSAKLMVNTGVPQGSILGPILFLMYINDLPNAADILKLYLFADDTSLSYSSKSIEDLEYSLNSNLTKINEWLLCNKLSLNISKSNFVNFHPSQKKPSRSPKIAIDSEVLEEKKTIQNT